MSLERSLSEGETPADLLNRALAARGEGELETAIALFAALCEQEPENSGAGCELAFTQLQAGRLADAEALCVSLLEHNPALRGALATLGVIHRQRGDHPGALGYFQRAAAVETGHVPTLFEIATCLRDLARLDEAAAVYFDVLALDPDSPGALRGLAETHLAMERHAASLYFYTLLGRRDPADLGVMCERGFALLRLGRTDDAEAAFRAALVVDLASPTPYRGLAQVARARDRPRPAIGYLNEALQRDPFDRWALMDLGFAHRALDERRQALEAFLAAAAIDPLWALPEAAAEHRALGELREAIAALRRVLDLDAEHLAACLQLAELARIKGDAEDSLRLCDALMERYPDRLEARIEKCRALIAADRGHEAIILARTIPAVGSGTTRPHRMRLEIAEACRDPAFAEEAVADAEPALGDMQVRLAAVATRLAVGDPASARSLLAWPTTPDRAFDIGRLSELRARLASLEWRPLDAIESFRAALEANPANPEAHRHLARLFLLTIEPERATEHLRQFLKRAATDRRLQGQSVRLSQNLVGQLLNELKSDVEALACLRRTAAPSTPIEEMIEVVSKYPASTPAALHLLLRLRIAGALDADDVQPTSGEPALIPCVIMTFWPDRVPPPGISRGIEAARDLHPGWELTVFNRLTGQAYLDANHSRDVAAAGRRALADGQFEDLLRLATLKARGGYFIDAHGLCLTPLDGAHPRRARLVCMQDEFAALSRTLVACAPDEAVIGRALGLAVEAINRGDNDIPWLATGPGLLSRAWAETLVGQGGDRVAWLKQRLVLDRLSLRSIITPEFLHGHSAA